MFEHILHVKRAIVHCIKDCISPIPSLDLVRAVPPVRLVDLKCLYGVEAHPSDIVFPKRISHEARMVCICFAVQSSAVSHVQVVADLVLK